MRVLQIKRMYLPALSIVAVVFLLLVLIGISTYRNLDREKRRTLDFVHRQGLALIRSLEAGARAGMFMPRWGANAIGSLIRETGKNDDIAYVFLASDQGIIVHHSDPSLDGKSTDWQPQFADDNQVNSRIRILADSSQVYEVAKRFSPFSVPAPFPRGQSMRSRPHKMTVYLHPNAIIVLGLRMTAFEEARSADLHHAIIMAAILLSLGTGVLFFVFVIQNYYLVDKTLKETQDYTTQVVANMANGLLSIDLTGKVVSYNRLALELLGLEETKIKEMTLDKVLDFRTTGINDTLSRGRRVLDREVRYQQNTGESVPLALSATPIMGNDGNCRGAVIILRDLREIKRLEEEVRRSEKLAAIGKLAASVAHEIRNPLSSIRGFARFLRHELSDRPREQEYAEVMVKEVDRINKVVNDLLTFSRPVGAELAPIDPHELLDHTLRLVQADAQARDVGIHTNIPANLTLVELDANQLTQALLNLLLNALQVSEAGERIEVGAVMDGSQLHVWVEDNGPGIAPDQKDKIFDPFFTTRERGTGLGLAIVQTIIENHRGEISVESPLSGRKDGSRFTISLPVESSEKASLMWMAHETENPGS